MVSPYWRRTENRHPQVSVQTMAAFRRAGFDSNQNHMRHNDFPRSVMNEWLPAPCRRRVAERR